MILKNIEKMAERTLQEIGDADDKSNMKAILQTCYYNLNSLKTYIKQNKSEPQQQSNQNKKITLLSKLKQKQSLPQLSISNINQNNCSFTSYSKEHAPYSKLQNFHSFQSSNMIKDQHRSQESLRNNKSCMKSQMFLQRVDNFSKSKQKLSSLKENTNFRSKILNSQKNKQKKMLNPLNKNQRYFEQQDVVISQDIVDQIGLYQAAHLYKHKNINKFIDTFYAQKMKPVINLRFASLGACSKDQLFLTQNSDFPILHPDDEYSEYISTFDPKTKIKQNFKIAEIIKQKYTQEAIFESEEKQEKEKQQQREKIDLQFSKNQKESTEQPFMNWIITIQNYEIIKNKQFYYFKCKSIEDWNQLSFILTQILKYLKATKIANVSFKLEKKLFLQELWSSKKIKFSKIEQLLKIRSNIRDLARKKTQERQYFEQQQKKASKRIFNTRQEIIKEIVHLWRDRKNLQIKKKSIKKRKEVLIRLALRMIVRYRVKKNVMRKLERVKQLNKKLCDGVWHPDVEIYLPSFSEEAFIRTSTQYMQTYENMFYHIWSSPVKQIILILPAINQNILKIVQQKMKMRKSITLICPDSHQIYPQNLPLAAYLLYSKQSINRIRKILQNRRGVIITGRFHQKNPILTENRLLQYEINLSDLLMVPLYCNLQNYSISKYLTNIDFNSIPHLYEDINEMKKFGINTPITNCIPQNSSHETLIENLSSLIVNNRQVKVWLLKLNGEFNGRGIALFDASSSKKLKQILLYDKAHSDYKGDSFEKKQTKIQSKIVNRLKNQLKLKVIEYMNTYFRLKLKINFENCIYRVEQYIAKFLKNGGIIQEQLQDCETFEFCFRNQSKNFNPALNRIQQQKIRLLSVCRNYCIEFVHKVSLLNYQNDLTFQMEKELEKFQQLLFNFLTNKYYVGYISIVGLFCNSSKKIYGLEIRPFMTQNSCVSQFLCWKQIKNSRKTMEQSHLMDRTSLRCGQNDTTIFGRSRREHFQQEQFEDLPLSENKIIKTYFKDSQIHLFIPGIVFTDVDEIAQSEIIENLINEADQQQKQIEQKQNFRKSHSNIDKGLLNDRAYGVSSQYLSLGLSLIILYSGEISDFRKMKKKSIEQIRSLSEKLEGCKMYRGKQEIRDVFRFGDIIRAISKMK